MEFKFGKELIKVLYKIRDAISGNNQDSVSNATLFDAIKVLFNKGYDENLMPVAVIYDDFIEQYVEESGFLLLKETPIDTKLENEKYTFLYDKSIELTYGIEGLLAAFSSDIDRPYRSTLIGSIEHTIEINGTTYYYYRYSGD